MKTNPLQKKQPHHSDTLKKERTIAHNEHPVAKKGGLPPLNSFDDARRSGGETQGEQRGINQDEE